MRYLLDANVFIQAKNFHYGFDFCPAFWDWVDRECNSGKIFSVEKVGDELRAGNDELADWAKDRVGTFFLTPDALTSSNMRTASIWATSHGYGQFAVNEFLQSADFYLVAHALAHGDVVVSQEKLIQSMKKIQIPNACRGLDIECITIFDLLRLEQPRFTLT